jgi:glycine/D-amino acid oxidase-like deaminating enzyme
MTIRVRRRHILLGAIGFALGGGTARALADASRLRVGVVGAGIVGASIAFHLARAGARVSVFEALGPAQGATRNSFAWLNALVPDRHYRDLRLASLAAYHELNPQLNLGIIWGGYLQWARDEAGAADVEATLQQLRDLPHAARRLDAGGILAISPQLDPGPVAAAAYSAIDGHLNPVWAARQFLEGAEIFGANVRYPDRVRAIDLRGHRLRGVSTSAGFVPLDRLVVAAGVESPRLLASVGYTLPLRHAPGLLAHSAPIPSLTQVVHDAPAGTGFKQMADGHLVAYETSEPPDVPAHAQIRHSRVDFPSDALRVEHGERILRKLGGFLPATRGVALGRVTLGFRPMPIDEHPILGKLPHAPQVFVAVTHSGVTLAPIIGRSITEEVLGGRRLELLAPYRPERFGTAAHS